MFGLEFLFSAALWALPLAGLPVVLHLLFRRKSPVVQFSTLRFIKASIQRTAARRKIHQRLLLATRILLLALLIWAMAQPAKMLAAHWFGTDRGVIAAIVVDNSYSMQLREKQASLLEQANADVVKLLQNELSAASVAIYPSTQDNKLQALRPASEVLSQWRPLEARGTVGPLVDRVESASAMLKAQNATDRWLIVISDLQASEFPRPMAPQSDLRTIVLDLHPQAARSMGVSRIRLEPSQPIPGINSKVIVDLVGRGGDGRAVTLRLDTPDGREIFQSSPQMAHLDSSGYAELEFGVQLSSDRWIVATARLQGEDAMPWDDQRSLLIEVPPQRTVTVLNQSAPAPAVRYVTLALDPSEGQQSSWPLRVKDVAQVDADSSAVVVLIGKWPDVQTVDQLRRIAQGGGVVVLMLQPGLELTWGGLSDAGREALLTLLPGAPAARNVTGDQRLEVNLTAGQGGAQEILSGLNDGAAPMQPIQVQRMVGFELVNSAVRTVLTAQPVGTSASAGASGLLFSRTVGEGTVYTLATLPDRSFTDLPLHPAFVPLLVRLALPTTNSADRSNVSLGQALSWSGKSSIKQMEVQWPNQERQRVDRVKEGPFTLGTATMAGLYRWRETGDGPIVGISLVQPGASESVLNYRPDEQVVLQNDSTLVVRSYEELQKKLGSLAEPQPKWSIPIAVVLVLLCAEAALGSGWRAK